LTGITPRSLSHTQTGWFRQPVGISCNPIRIRMEAWTYLSFWL